MKPKSLLYIALCSAAATSAWAAPPPEWTAGWGQGISEFFVDDGHGNELNIACPDYADDGYIRAHATINGQSYSSNQGSGFDVTVDGETYHNPFFTDCRVCAIDFPDFWEDLRKARKLEISADGQTVTLPTRKLSAVIKPLQSQDNPCQPAW